MSRQARTCTSRAAPWPRTPSSRTTRRSARTNIGAGTITCNYDGVNKNKTIIEDGVFIGSDTQLVAPVRVGKGAYVGAGSTITKDVPPDALALTRVPQKNVEGWAVKRRGKLPEK